MRVRTDLFLKKLTEGNALAVQTAARDAGYPPKDVKVEAASGTYRIILEAADPSKLGDIEPAVKNKVDLTDWTSSTSGNTLSWTLTPTAQRALAEQATEQAQRIIESRLDAVGVAEPLVQRHGALTSHQILGANARHKDPERVKECSRATRGWKWSPLSVRPALPVQTYTTKEEAESSLVRENGSE